MRHQEWSAETLLGIAPRDTIQSGPPQSSSLPQQDPSAEVSETGRRAWGLEHFTQVPQQNFQQNPNRSYRGVPISKPFLVLSPRSASRQLSPEDHNLGAGNASHTVASQNLVENLACGMQKNIATTGSGTQVGLCDSKP